jgi:superfamily II DNA or RNA helicase
MTATDRTYGRLELDGDRWIIASMDAHVRIKLKALFPKVPKAAGPPYILPADPVTAADLEWFTSRYPLAIDDEHAAALAASGMAFHARQSAANRLLTDEYQPKSTQGWKRGKSPRPHQAIAAELLQLVGGLLVGDDVGMGKTFTVMAAALIPNALPAIVVCDPHLQQQWRNRIWEYTTLSTHTVTSMTPYDMPDADIRLFRWTQLVGWADAWEEMNIGLVAFDECQELRTGIVSQRGVSTGRLTPRARYRLGLTATPIYNYGVEIWNVMSFLRPEVLGEKGDFIREWAPSGHVSDPKALGTYLRDQHALVRKRKAVNRVNRIIQVVDHDADSLGSIEALAQQLATTAATGSFTERGEATRELDLRVREQTGIAKAAAVADVVRILVEAGEPVILAGWHREVYSIWNERLADLAPAMHTGSETPLEKAKQVRRFLDGETDVFIISLRSGRGLDGLQAKSRIVVFGELDWSPQVHDQVIGRADREGSVVDGTDGTIDAIFLVAEDGSDPPMMEVLGLKASQSHAIVDPDLGVERVRREGEGLRRLVQQYLHRGETP